MHSFPVFIKFWLKRGSNEVVIAGAVIALCAFFPLRGSTNGWEEVLASVMLFRGSMCVFSSSLIMTCFLVIVLVCCCEVRPNVLTECENLFFSEESSFWWNFISLYYYALWGWFYLVLFCMPLMYIEEIPCLFILSFFEEVFVCFLVLLSYALQRLC